MQPRSRTYQKDRRGIYHVWNKIVRGLYLFGKDPLSGKDYSYRRAIIIKRILYLAQFFFIDLISFSVMINHFHLILRNLPNMARQANAFDVMFRAIHVFPDKFRRMGVKLDDVQKGTADDRIRELCEDQNLVDEMRSRLSDISWFMKQLNQHLATRFNREDGVTGSFWATRFKCRELTGIGELLICCIYVELNQIRAGEATKPEDSQHSSIFWRIAGLKSRQSKNGTSHEPPTDAQLIPIHTNGDGETRFQNHWRASQQGLFEEVTLPSYLSLVDAIGRQARDGAASIPDHLQPILARVDLSPDKIHSAMDAIANRS